MHGLLRGDTTPEELARRWGIPASRAGLYQRFVRNHTIRVLDKNYGELARLIGKDRWNELTDRYFREHPPRDYELNASVADFVQFVGARAQADELGLGRVHLELAELSWARFRAFADAQDVPTDVSAPTLNPTLQILETEYPVLTLWRSLRKLDADAPPDLPLPLDAPRVVFVLRKAVTHGVASFIAEDTHLFALKMVHDDMSVEAAASATGLDAVAVRGILQQGAEAGVLVLPR